MVEDNARPVNYFLKEKFVDRYDFFKPKLIKVNRYGEKMGIVYDNSNKSLQLADEFLQWLKKNGFVKESKWNRKMAMIQLRYGCKGVLGYERQFTPRVNGKKTSSLFICLDDIKEECNRVLKSLVVDEENEEISLSAFITNESSENNSDSDDTEIEYKDGVCIFK